MNITPQDFGDKKRSYYNLPRSEAPTLRQIELRARICAIKELRDIDKPNNHVFSMQVDKVLELKNPEKKRLAIKAAREHHQRELNERDIPAYRTVRRQLTKWMKSGEHNCEHGYTPWTGIELKHAHLLWGFRNLFLLKLIEDRMPQMDLFP